MTECFESGASGTNTTLSPPARSTKRWYSGKPICKPASDKRLKLLNIFKNTEILYDHIITYLVAMQGI